MMKNDNVRSALVDVISGLFILLFVYTGINKLYDHTNFQNVIGKSPLVGNAAPYVSWGLPAFELLVAALLCLPRTRKIGLYISLLMMVGFTGYLIFMIYFTPTLPCSCGGVLSQMSWKQHLVFNVFFTLLALLGILLDRKNINRQNESVMKNNSSAPSYT